MSMLSNSAILAAAIVADAIVGDPKALWRHLPHPVVLIGKVISLLENRLNINDLSDAEKRRRGLWSISAIVVGAAVIGVALEIALAAVPYGWIVRILLVAVFLAGRSLFDHVAAVASAFSGGLDAARQTVSLIVGRDPAALDEAGVSRAAIESTAENFSDGVVAPALWFALLGLPGLLAYKAINTADSMIGHMNDRYREFGQAAALLDDFVNLPASRLAGGLIALAAPLAGGSVRTSLRVMVRDARKHKSPNAGWPEAAMASALGLALAGPRIYGGVPVPDPFMNAEGRRDATRADITRAQRVYVGANVLLFSLVAVIALAL